ncbi:Oidioi.mRNA.OKI2018_I69.PAR.g10966.t1.cds [Oikopleura dioica]|uniref:E3 ubiquitin-protein ligase RNF10 n=1 Tax=Oikopleura dioica TaxID=34765 RepID=A0ABN7S0N9_OIKDI|nr:Oidioi.mRNA.OKI2018_I69.PAR.g10966.t1.cds [Oikopleura dioica]
MSSKNLSLVSSGHQARQREINHRPGPKGSKKGHGQSNQSKTNQNRNWGSNRASKGYPMPSAGKQNLIAEALDDGPVMQPGKKNNFNHLLSFQDYSAPAHSNNSSSSSHNRRTRYNSFKRPMRSKEDFVQANSQFVIREGCELEMEPFKYDPDLSIPWKFIEVARFFSQEQTECPICLHPPIAAQVGRCGHAHCYSCILKLLTICEKPQCPVCFGHIKKADLRSAILEVEKRPRKGTKVEFVKMNRERSSVVAKMVSTKISENGSFFGRYERIVEKKANEIISNVLDREEAELAVQEVDTEESERPFIQQAKQLVAQRKGELEKIVSKNKNSKMQEIEIKPKKEKSPAEEAKKVEEGKSEPEKLPPKEQTPQQIASEIISDLLGKINFAEKREEKELTPPISLNDVETSSIESDDSDNSYYFYQAVGCTNIFLGSLNAKCMTTEFGTIKDAPERFSASLVELEDFTMEMDLRKRFRYLSHLSCGESFSLAYVNINDLGLSKETLEKHKSHITAKKKKIKTKDRQENKASAEIQEYYDRELYGKYRAPEFEISSEETFPDLMISQEESPELSPIRAVDAPVKSISGAWAKKSNATFDLEADFAPLGGGSSPLLPGGSSGSFWDSMKKTSASENTKGQAKKAPTSPAAFEQDDFLPPPTRTLGDEFAKALNAAAATKAAPKPEEDKKPKRAQKKKKGIVLAF